LTNKPTFKYLNIPKESQQAYIFEYIFMLMPPLLEKVREKPGKSQKAEA
jgi:hypothetical protein